MDAQFFCRECGANHAEPADAHLGHLVICLECAVAIGFLAVAAEAAAVIAQANGAAAEMTAVAAAAVGADIAVAA